MHQNALSAELLQKVGTIMLIKKNDLTRKALNPKLDTEYTDRKKTTDYK